MQLTATTPLLAPVAKLLPSEAMSEFLKSANDALECGFAYNDAVRAGWTSVCRGWEKPPEGKRWVKKENPTSCDVHVDGIMGGETPPNQKKKKQTIKEDAMNGQMLKILKVDEEQRIAYGWASVICIKGVPYEDVQGDIIDAPTLEKAVGDFMFDVRRSLAMHERNSENKIEDSMVKGTVIHSMPLTPEIKKALGVESDMDGWVVGVKVFDDDVWKKVKSGELAAFSIGGRGYRVPADSVEKFNPNHDDQGRFSSGPGGGEGGGGDGGHAEHGFDLTHFGKQGSSGPGNWPKFKSHLGLEYRGKVTTQIPSSGGGEPLNLSHFEWRNKNGLTVRTGNNPETGEYYSGQRAPEKGYASYMGAAGPASEIKRFASAVHQHATYIKDESKGTSDYI